MASWIVGRGREKINIAGTGVMQKNTQDDPAVARGVVQHMGAAWLAYAYPPASESDTAGRVAIVTGAFSTGLSPKSGLLSTLGLKHSVDGIVLLDEAPLEPQDFSGPNAAKCFCLINSYEDEDEAEENLDKAKVKRPPRLWPWNEATTLS